MQTTKEIVSARRLWKEQKGRDESPSFRHCCVAGIVTQRTALLPNILVSPGLDPVTLNSLPCCTSGWAAMNGNPLQLR